MPAHIDPVVEAIDVEIGELDLRIAALTGDRDRLLAARQLLVNGPPEPASPSSVRKTVARSNAPATNTTKPSGERGKKRAPQKPRHCEVCGRLLGSGPALASHMRSAHRESAGAPPAGRPSIDEIQALEAQL